MITQVAYRGWEHNLRLTNGQIELIATLDVGPRIIRFAFLDGPNVMKEFSTQLGKVGEDEWMIRGGHRLWHAPEAKPRTYALDNRPVDAEIVNDFSMRLHPAPEVDNGIQKAMEITMAAETNVVTITHRLTNIGSWAITLAPWALTVLDAGGTAIVPLPEKRAHTEVLTPDFPVILWPYTDMSDPRLRWGRRFITFSQDATKGPSKFGMALQSGWAAYQVHGALFVKYFDYLPDAVYPDMGCNFETFSNEEMLEVESLGPVTLLQPGETVEHVETWRLLPQPSALTSEEDLDQLRSLIEA